MLCRPIRGSADLVGQIIERDEQRKLKLLEIYNKIRELLTQITGDNVEEELKTEFGDVSGQIKKYQEQLQIDECPIVVAGETSSGKSSLINLILGRDILPEQLLSCTTTICRIRNKDQMAISVITEDNEKREIEISPEADDSTLQYELEKYVSRESDQENYKYVDIELPISQLKDRHLIIDTPGIGTSQELTDRLLDYLPNAMAFIYVINVAQAGGLQSDRLLKIFENQRERMKRDEMHEFDTTTTIFVCNKWDQVDRKEEDKIWSFICDKLDKNWPNFDSKQQLYKLSVKQERTKRRKHKPFTENFTNLLAGIDRLIPASLESKVARHARWQNIIMQKIYHRLVSKILYSKKTADEKLKRKKEIEYAATILKPQLKQFKEEIKMNAKAKCTNISKRLHQHLQEKSTFDRISKFGVHEYPEGRYKWFIEDRAKGMIIDRVNAEIREWCRNEKIENITKELDELLMTKFKAVESKIQEIVNDPYHYELCLEKVHSEQKEIRDRNFLDAYTDIFMSGWRLIIFPLPFAITALLSPILIALAAKDLYDQSDDYKARTHEYMQRWCKDIIKEFSEQNIKNIITETYLNEFNAKVENLCDTVIPKQIEAEEKSINNIIKDIRSSTDIRDTYDPLMEKCKHILGFIILVDMEFFSGCEIQEYKTEENKQIYIGEGAHANVFKNMVGISGEYREVAIKHLKQPLLMSDPDMYIQLNEVRILREFKHPNIVELYGMSYNLGNDGEKHLNIFMELCDDNLENIVMDSNKKETKRCFKSLSQEKYKEYSAFYFKAMIGACTGLSYIHAHGFVHRDLKLSNILIKDGIPKIADVGIAKEVNLITGTYAGSPLTMAPEVFEKRVYSTEADIYSLGISLWEMWYGRPAFTQIIDETSGKYAFLYNFPYLLHDHVKKGNRPDFDDAYKPPELLQNLIQKCWSENVTTRPTAEEVLEELNNIGIRIE